MMDFLRRLDPGRASTAAAARPALPPRMASAPMPSLGSPGSRLAASSPQPVGTAPGAAGAWLEGMATRWHADPPPAGHGAPQASVGGALRGPVPAAPATPDQRTNRALQPQRPLAHTAPPSALQNRETPPRGPPVEPSRGLTGRLEPKPLRVPLRAATAAFWQPGGLPRAAPGQPLSAAALQARAPDPATATAAPAPTLHVTIDRIEVRAAVASPKPAPAPRQPKAPAVSLADYLRAGVRPKASP